MEQQAATAPGRQAPYAGYAPQPYGGASTSSGTAVKGERSDMQEALMGIGLGLVIGVVERSSSRRYFSMPILVSAYCSWAWAMESGGASTGSRGTGGRGWLWPLSESWPLLCS